MPRATVLYVCHNHPLLRPGGAEAYAYELFRAVQAADDFEPVFLAKCGPPHSDAYRPHPGTCFAPVEGRENEYFFFTQGYGFDPFFGTMSFNKELYTKHFRTFLEAIRPDVVHFQHTLHLGYDLIREVRNTLPGAPILYTLHEFIPICHHHGQMVRTTGHELCDEESPRRCHECFPHITPERFFLRKRFIQSHLGLVDLFLAPSRQLRERIVEWGIPPERIVFEEYGRAGLPERAEPPPRARRNRVGFIGQVTRFKGADVLVRAIALLEAAGVDVRCRLHGANFELQSREYREEFQSLLDETTRTVTFVGQYEHHELPAIMADVDWIVVPSIWWENSPLVIQEAFAYGKPVICSDVGGMAEKVEHGVSGLHFRVGDPESLAETIRTAVTTGGLWERLHAGIPDVYRMQDHVERLGDIYCELLNARAEGGSREWTATAAG